MNKNKYNQLREEIIKANKDIVALEFGCKIEFVGSEAIVYKKIDDLHIYTVNNLTMVAIKSIDKIIGRPISLEDCLIAIKKEIEKDNIGHSDGYGYIMDLCYRAQPNSWIMGKPLQDQSDECKELLWDLICKE